jgi:hypothetical protein
MLADILHSASARRKAFDSLSQRVIMLVVRVHQMLAIEEGGAHRGTAV